MNFTIENIGSMTMICGESGTVFKAMDTETLTDRKLNNAIKSVTKFYKSFTVTDKR